MLMMISFFRVVILKGFSLSHGLHQNLGSFKALPAQVMVGLSVPVLLSKAMYYSNTKIAFNVSLKYSSPEIVMKKA